MIIINGDLVKNFKFSIVTLIDDVERIIDNSIKAIKSRIDRLEVKEKPKENQIIRINISEGNEFYSNYPIEVKNLNISYDDKEY